MFFLLLHPYKKSFLKIKGHHKLAPKFYGTYNFLQNLGSLLINWNFLLLLMVTQYFMSLVSRKLLAPTSEQTVLLELDNEGSIIFKPTTILNRSPLQLRSRSITEVLIQLRDMQQEDATLEPLLQIQQQFPHLKL